MKQDYNFFTLLNACRKLGLKGINLFLQIVTPGSGVATIKLKNYPFPVYIRKNTSDERTFFEIFCSRSYEINYGLMPEVIIDCGANVGYASVFFKTKYPEATIIAIEPELSNFKMLQQNTKQCQNVHLLNCGVWNRATNLEIVDTGEGNWAFETKEVEYENEKTVKAISINDIMERFNLQKIDILKIDIEGAEKEMFEKNFENWLPFTNIIIIEFHDRIRKGSSKSFFKALINYDFSLKRKGENLIFFIENHKK